MSITVAGMVLLVISAVVFGVTFFLPEERGGRNGVNGEAAREEIRDLVRQEVDGIRGHVEEVVEESMTYAMEKTERSLERLSNEKIMAVSEYSDTVMQEIHKSHEEVMFLYDMLNNKHETLKKTVSEAGKAAKEMQDTVENFRTLRDPEKPAGEEKSAGTERKEFTGLAETGIPKPAAAEGASKPRKQRKTPQKELSSTAPLLREMRSQRNAAAGGTELSGEKAVLEEELPLPAEAVPAPPAEGDTPRNNNEKILELHRNGKSNVAIARELGLGVGEVKLVIDLFNNI